MTEEVKNRRCLRCRTQKLETDFPYTKSKFFPNHRSLICTSCLEIMVHQDNLNEVDALCRYLDIPFEMDRWTTLYATHKDHTLTAYLNTLLDSKYDSISWADENERWRQAREEGTIDDEIKVINESKMRRLRAVWSSSYSTE